MPGEEVEKKVDNCAKLNSVKFKIGEMERDSFISHGSTVLINEWNYFPNNSSYLSKLRYTYVYSPHQNI